MGLEERRPLQGLVGIQNRGAEEIPNLFIHCYKIYLQMPQCTSSLAQFQVTKKGNKRSDRYRRHNSNPGSEDRSRKQMKTRERRTTTRRTDLQIQD
jgi:hypothetical protein